MLFRSCRKGDPFQGRLKLDSCLTLGNELSEEIHVLTKQEILLGNAGVQPRWIQGDSKVGTESASLEKYIFNYRYIERLEMDSVVGRLVEKRRLNNLDYME